MFGFVKQILISAITFFSCNALKCIQVNDQTCSEIVNVNSDEPVFYPSSVKINKCSGSCNNINYLYAKKCISDVVQDINVKVYNLISRSNETRHIKQHKNCNCNCRFGTNLCNNRQRWNEDNCRCECEELIHKGNFDKGFIWNPSTCECDKSCEIGEYLGYQSCKCRRKIVDKIVEECTKIIDEKETYPAKLY